MTSQWSYTLTHYDESSSWTSTDITSEVNSMPLVTDTGTGDVNSARVILSANNGKFIITSPVIDQYDRIRIQIDDGDSTTTNYDKYFEVIKILPSESKSEGTRLELFLMGLEYHLQKINYIKPHFFEGANEVMEDIGNQYNDSHGTQQPTLLGHDSDTYNELPTKSFQRNNYDYGSNEVPCYDRMNEVADSLAMAVSEGGALDFYDFKFVVPNTTSYPIVTYNPITHMMLKVFSSGNNIAPGSQKIVSDSTSVNVGETDSGIDNETGTNVLAWGAAEAGSLPIAYSQFQSAELRYPLYPEWNVDQVYLIGSKVQRSSYGLFRRINTDSTAPAPNPPELDSDWETRSKDQDYGTPYQYSQWTDNLANSWKDSGIDPDDINSSGEIGPGFNDGNMVVWDTNEATDGNWFRTWVDVRETSNPPNPSNISSDATLKKYLFNDDTFYRGFRVMLENNVTSSSGKWQGTDLNGKSFSKALVECITPGTAATAVWKVKYVAVNDLSCIVRHEGIPFRVLSGSWWATSGGYGADTDGDCLHPYDAVTNVAGLYGSTFTSNVDSAIKVEYNFEIDPLTGQINNATQKHKAGAWVNFTFPFPHAEINGNIDVGFWYGGRASGADAVCEPATLDVENMHMSPQGYRGFNNGDPLNTECFGQISSIDFWLRIDHQAKVGLLDAYTPTTEPNIEMSCLMIDTSDNTVKQDFVVPFNNQWLPYKLPISGFQTYRARKPKDSIVDTFIPPKDLTINNQIEWRNIKQIIIQTSGSYDSFGRYSDSLSTGNKWCNQNIKRAGVEMGGFQYRKLDMYIDAFHFSKPLLVYTGPDTSKDIESDFLEKPEVFDYFQLKNIAEAERQKRKFRHVEFEVNTTGKFDVEFGDYFKFKHARLISNGLKTGDIGGINYIELVAKRIEYSITKPVDGKGGFLRKILGVRRFV